MTAAPHPRRPDTSAGHFLLVLALLAGVIWPASGSHGAEPAPRPILWIVDPPPSTAAEQALLASAQGLLNRTSATVWVRSPGLNRIVLAAHTSRFDTITVPSAWALILSNRPRFDRFLTCSVTNRSFNLATSLAGPRDALVVDASLRDQALAAGLREEGDLREHAANTPSALFDRFASQATRNLLIHQPISKALHLRDLAVARNAWVDFEPVPDFLPRLVAALGPETEVLGWGSDEHTFVREVSRGGGWVIPSDWCLNLSAHRWLTEPLPPRPTPPPFQPARPGQRLVCFVVSDGDNIQWLLNGFTERPGFWSSLRRGSIPVTWELAPRLVEFAPAAAAWLHRTATPLDDFVGGPSGGGYHFPQHVPDRDAIARRSAQALAAARLRITSVLDSGGQPRHLDTLLADPRIDGVLYKDYAPYNKRAGAVEWIAGKPVASYRFLLWEQKRPDGSLRPDWLPEGVAAAIAKSSDDPTRSTDAFSLIQVHAWSFRDRGGPMEAIHDTVRRLPPGTRVVTATEFLHHLRAGGR